MNSKGNSTKGREKNRSDEKKFESWSENDLYEKAEELEITGRGDMDKDELIEAIREQLKTK